MRARTLGSSLTRATNSSSDSSVADRILARLSVEGQRSFPLAVPRLLLLKVVGSNPASLAKPEGDMPCRAARASMARQICGWVSIRNQTGLYGYIPNIIHAVPRQAI